MNPKFKVLNKDEPDDYSTSKKDSKSSPSSKDKTRAMIRKNMKN